MAQETTEKGKSLLTPEVKALIGQATEVTEMYDVVDKESIRRYVIGIPDQDPRHWDEELARSRYGGVTAPALMVTYTAGRRPPWQEDTMDEAMNTDWFGQGGGMGRRERGLPPVRPVPGGRSRYLHTGDEVEIYRYPRLGDRVFYQSKYVDIQEKTGRSGPFLMVTRETRYWNQDNETLCTVRTVGAISAV